MLPGFRFLFAAIMLLLSILIFGLGAAALLRAAHEEFASNPSWHATPETIFAQQTEAPRREAPRPEVGRPNATRPEAARPDATRAVLAMLRVDAPVGEKSPDVPPAAAPLALAEQAAPLSTPAEPERIAALKPEDSSPPEPAKPEIPVSESPAKTEAASALADAPVPADETRIAATGEAAPPANEAARAASGQTSAPASPDTDLASKTDLAPTKIATLDGPPVTIEAQPSVKAAGAKPDASVIQKRLQARRAAQRRRMAARARLARQALQQQQIPNPFAPRPIQPAIQQATAR
jgi:hypothetical protein